jgi:hypothetical protein
MIPRIRDAVRGYAFQEIGDYRVWPGPNSNTFVATVMSAVSEISVMLPPTAISKDFQVDGRWIGMTLSDSGIRINLRGYAGLTVGWVEGIEVNILGAIAGVDFRRPALKLPGPGRLGAVATPCQPPTPLS